LSDIRYPISFAPFMPPLYHHQHHPSMKHPFVLGHVRVLAVQLTIYGFSSILLEINSYLITGALQLVKNSI